MKQRLIIAGAALALAGTIAGLVVALRAGPGPSEGPEGALEARGASVPGIAGGVALPEPGKTDEGEAVALGAPAPLPAEDAYGGSGLPAPAAALDRKIIQNASLDLAVEDVDRAFNEVGRIASSAGGFVASSSFYSQEEQRFASATLRVPAERYEDVLTQLRRLALEVVGQSSSSQDVTGEYTDLQSQLRNLEAAERQYLLLLEQARTITDILTVQDRLNQTRGEIEYVKGRMNLLESLSDMASIDVALHEPLEAEKEGPAKGVDPLLGAVIGLSAVMGLLVVGGTAYELRQRRLRDP